MQFEIDSQNQTKTDQNEKNKAGDPQVQILNEDFKIDELLLAISQCKK